jgi:Ca2+/Na+ antiporter
MMIVLYFHFCGSISAIVITKLQLQSSWKKTIMFMFYSLKKNLIINTIVMFVFAIVIVVTIVVVTKAMFVITIVTFILYFEKKGEKVGQREKNKDYNGSTKLGSCLTTERKFIMFTIVMVMFIVSIVVLFSCFVKERNK